MHTLVWASAAGLVLIAAYRSVRVGSWRALITTLVLLCVFLGLLAWAGTVQLPWQEGLVSRGESNGLLVGALYTAMLMGMFSNYLFEFLDKPRHKRKRFDWQSFIAPVFASPMVFVPLALVFDNAPLRHDSADQSRLLLFIIAYQNGFFWRDFFKNFRKVSLEARRG